MRSPQMAHIWPCQDMQMKKEEPHFKFEVGHLNELKIQAHVSTHVGVFGFVMFARFEAPQKINP